MPELEFHFCYLASAGTQSPVLSRSGFSPFPASIPLSYYSFPFWELSEDRPYALTLTLLTSSVLFLFAEHFFFFKDAVESKTKREGTGLFENGVFSWMTSLCAVRSGYHRLLVVLPEQTVAIWSVPWSDRIQHCKSGANLTRVFILMGTGEVVILCLMDTPLPSIDVKIKGLLCWSPAYLCLSENTDLLQGSASPAQQQPAHWQAPIPRW